MSKFEPVKYEAEGCRLEVFGMLLEADSPAEAIARYRQGEIAFWNSWRGSFCGTLHDEKQNITLLFNDHIGSKMLFYAQTEDGVVWSRDLRELSRQTGLHQPNETFIQAILEHGYTSNNNTIILGIHRLLAGQYLHIRGKEAQLISYHRFANTPWPYNEAEMLAETDRLFRQAVERVIRKNECFGLQHYFPLSGGLDSRMCQIVARQLAKHPITNFTYSQTGHYDHVLPQEISNYLGNEWQFMPLNGGEYLTQIDAISAATQWLINYNGPAEIYAFVSRQDWTGKGVVLTGVNGDNILSVITDGSREIDLLYSLSFAGNGIGSPQVLQHYTESYSPFCDVDFLEYVLHIPNEKRRNYAFYDKWILTYYPEAAQWHHKHELIGHRHKTVTIAGRNMPLRDVPERLLLTTLKRLHIYDGYRIDEDSMNPYDRWATENPLIIEKMEAYYTEHKHLLKDKDLSLVCAEKMRRGTIIEKCKVLTILSALKAFAGSDEPMRQTTSAE